MDLRQIEEVIKNSNGEMVGEKKDNIISNLNNDQYSSSKHSVNAASALQMFLDHIPITSIPCIKKSPVVELKTGDSVRDAIQLLYEMNVSGALISDIFDSTSDAAAARLLDDRYIGFIDFASMVLWCIEKYDEALVHDKDEINSVNGFFSMLDQYPQIGQTKVGELGKSFLWDPFFPVHMDATLLRILLLFAKHRMQVVPVMDRSSPLVIGFVTQNAVIELLLQSSGLDWFDEIADKSLSQFWFEHKAPVNHVYGDQSISETMHILQRNRNGAIAIVDRGSGRLIGNVRSNDVHLLLDDDDLFNNRKSVTIEEFIHQDADNTVEDPTIEKDNVGQISAGSLRLRNELLPRMDSPVTNKKSDSLKLAMEKLSEIKNSFSFIVDELQQFSAVLTLRDIIIQFAPPCVDSRIRGGGFFESALEQTGCHDEDGTIVCNN